MVIQYAFEVTLKKIVNTLILGNLIGIGIYNKFTRVSSGYMI